MGKKNKKGFNLFRGFTDHKQGNQNKLSRDIVMCSKGYGKGSQRVCKVQILKEFDTRNEIKINKNKNPL